MDAIPQKDETDATRAYGKAKQLAVLKDADLLPYPRTNPPISAMFSAF